MKTQLGFKESGLEWFILRSDIYIREIVLQWEIY